MKQDIYSEVTERLQKKKFLKRQRMGNTMKSTSLLIACDSQAKEPKP